MTDWPLERNHRAIIASQFGDARVELIEWALATGDPLADAVAEKLVAKDAKAQRDLQKGLTQGIDAVEDPDDAVAALLHATETRPAYATDELLDQGTRGLHSIPLAIHSLSLGIGALTRTYRSPAIAEVLMGTGRLHDGAQMRLEETGKWLLEAMLPGALRVGERGYIATIQVRLLHARVRIYARRGGFSEERYGVPINQVDLARTWMDFTLISQTAESSMGFRLTTEDTENFLRVWWHVGHLLGIDPRLVEGIADLQQAARIDAMFEAVNGAPTEKSTILTRSTVNSVEKQLTASLPLPRILVRRLLWALLRRFHGDTVADDLGVPPTPLLSALLPVAAGMITISRSRKRRHTTQWQELINQHIEQTKNGLHAVAESAEYEKSTPVHS